MFVCYFYRPLIIFFHFIIHIYKTWVIDLTKKYFLLIPEFNHVLIDNPHVSVEVEQWIKLI